MNLFYVLRCCRKVWKPLFRVKINNKSKGECRMHLHANKFKTEEWIADSLIEEKKITKWQIHVQKYSSKIFLEFHIINLLHLKWKAKQQCLWLLIFQRKHFIKKPFCKYFVLFILKEIKLKMFFRGFRKNQY